MNRRKFFAAMLGAPVAIAAATTAKAKPFQYARGGLIGSSGEYGQECIMPFRHMADGRLGPPVAGKGYDLAELKISTDQDQVDAIHRAISEARSCASSDRQTALRVLNRLKAHDRAELY